MLNTMYQRRSLIVASLIAIAAFVWVMSGVLTSEASLPPDSPSLSTALPTVSVENRQAEYTWRQFNGAGTVAARRAANVTVAQAGRVVAVNVDEGERVEASAVLIQLSPKQIPQQQSLAKAQLAQAELQYQSTQKLFNQGLANKLRLAEAKSALEKAKTDYETAKVSVQELQLKAPFAGSVEAVDVELGDYVRVGDRAVRLLEKDHLLVTAEVMADVAAELTTGTELSFSTRSGQRYRAKVSFVASEPDERSRLYRVEAQIAPAADSSTHANLVIGQPVEVTIPLQRLKAHRVTPSLLWLSSDGEMGVRGVDENSQVTFYAADFLRSENGDIWLTGLPDDLQLIVAGQGLVRTGATVTVQQSNQQ